MLRLEPMEYLSDLHKQTTEETTACLAKFFDSSIKQADDISSSYGRLWRHMQTVVMHGGKRLRPYLTVVGSGDYSDISISKIIPIAAAQELLHTALLMHDDVIDRDDKRHGVDNLNGLYKKDYVSATEPDRTHYAYSTAILAGDLLIAAAHKLINQSSFAAEQKQAALAQLYQSIFEVAGGELMDVEASFLDTDELHALPIAEHKTASYSFVGPLVTGALLTQKPAEYQQNLREFALNLGVAFQLQDDLLGVFGDEDITGKSTVNDIKEAKRTLIIEEYLASSGFDKKLYNLLFGNASASNEDITKLKASIERSGARQKTEETIASYADKAQTALQSIDSQNPARIELTQFVDKLLLRQQ